MKNYVGIDLGRTNSVICTYDGSQTQIWKSPAMKDVTPSAIYIDRQGNEYVGQTAYDAAPRSPDNCAILFKRFMGTNIRLQLPAVNLTLTPEECSAKVLATLFGYLPEEIRNSPDTGTIVTVPTAFNQMQKSATMEAAKMAGIGKVTLIQEPVAAVMSIMHRIGKTNGIFLIYEFSRGTFDVALADSIRGRVNLLAQGGIQMCGGRDFDRSLVNNLVLPWLHENFELPDDFCTNPTFKPLLRLATWATERAKIELSARDETMINLSEIGMLDLEGNEVYLDIPLQRSIFDNLIENQVNDTITAARETLLEAGLTPNDLESIVWVGGPTHYKPLRDKVAFELGITGDTLAVNPMTAVAEGASIFAKSIDWHSEGRETRNTSEEALFGADQRQDRLFNTHGGMDLLQNPFYILNATQRDNRHKIMELAEKKSLLSDAHDWMAARTTLTNPRKRISAEVAWLSGMSPERVHDILLLLEASAGNRLSYTKTASTTPIDSLAKALVHLPYAKRSNVADEVLETLKLSQEDFTEIGEFLGIHTLTPIARTNLLAARILRLPDYSPDVVAEWILAIAQIFEAITPEEVHATLNKERRVSGFPEITESLAIETEIRNRRLYYQQVIKSALENILTAKARVRAVTTVLLGIESTTKNSENRWPILIEDTVDSYEIGVEVFLETIEKNIETQVKKIRIAADGETSDAVLVPMVDELLQIVKDWDVIAQPIQLNKNRQGLRHNASHDVANRVRQLSIFLFNEYDKLDFSQQILNVLQEVFTEIPEITERITADLETLNRIAE